MEQKEIYDHLNSFFQDIRLVTLYREVRELFHGHHAEAHNWEHVRRDIVNCVEIGVSEGADMDIVLPAVVLHDLGYITHPDTPEDHPINGSRECYRYLTGYKKEQQDRISSCILKHKGKFPGFDHAEPETLEEMVVCDSDQIDKFGWVGLVQLIRVFAEHGGKGNDWFTTIPGMADAISHQKSIVLYTETGKQIAERLKDPDFLTISEKLSKELVLYEGWKEPS